MNLACIGYTSWTSRVVLYVFCMIILHHRKYHFIRNIALGSKFVMYSLPLTKSLISCKSASIFLTDCSSSLDLFCVRKMLSLPKEYSHSQKKIEYWIDAHFTALKTYLKLSNKWTKERFRKTDFYGENWK